VLNGDNYGQMKAARNLIGEVQHYATAKEGTKLHKFLGKLGDKSLYKELIPVPGDGYAIILGVIRKVFGLRREVRLGTSDVAQAWTNGDNIIWIGKETIDRLVYHIEFNRFH